MNQPNLKSAPRIDRKASRAHLAQFEEWTGTKAPRLPLEEITDEFLEYCDRNCLSRDWIYRGDPRGAIMPEQFRAKGEAA